MICIKNIRLRPDEDKGALFQKCAGRLSLLPQQITQLKILKKSLDCRKKSDVHWICTVAVKVDGKLPPSVMRREDVEPYVRREYTVPTLRSEDRPVVVGMGPTGLFAALVLARAGLKPVLLERGDPVEVRREKVERYWQEGALDEESNVQFGEGGAGTFSDGKLNTGIRDERIAFVLETLHRFGAHESVTFDARPHVGTDVLAEVVKNMREELISLGAEVIFNARFTGFDARDSVLQSVTYEKNGQEITLPARHAVLALGHSARDSFRMLCDRGIAMSPMPFAVGVRIEHKQSMIDLAQYGKEALSRYELPPAEYKLSYRSPTGTKVHTFCMCPGGSVVAASSERDAIVTNGMSNSARDGKNANSALLVSLDDSFFEDASPLRGIRLQKEIEQRAFRVGGGNHFAPAQLVGDFLQCRTGSIPDSVQPSYRPGVTFCDLREVLGEKICSPLREALLWMDTKIKGFAHPEAILTAPETRSSSPVRILRDERRNASVKGILPCGEGAGYAGGIVSAAVDGILCAESVMQDLTEEG